MNVSPENQTSEVAPTQQPRRRTVKVSSRKRAESVILLRLRNIVGGASREPKERLVIPLTSVPVTPSWRRKALVIRTDCHAVRERDGHSNPSVPGTSLSESECCSEHPSDFVQVAPVFVRPPENSPVLARVMGSK